MKTFVEGLIADPDIIKSIGLHDYEVLRNIVARTGASVDAFFSFFYKDERHEKTVFDVGVLRYPQPFDPYFKVSFETSLCVNESSYMSDGISGVSA